MKKLFCIISILIFMFNFITAQENLFDKVKTDFTVSKAANEKIERFKSRRALKQWEINLLHQNIILSENFKGVFNIFDKKLEFEITEDYGEDVQGIHGFIANLSSGGYAVISSFKEGITATIFYAEQVFNIEVVDNNLYFISEINLEEISFDSPSDYGDLIREDNSFLIERDLLSVTPATIKVLVVYTSAAAQAYGDIVGLITNAVNVTNNAYSSSQATARIELAHT